MKGQLGRWWAIFLTVRRLIAERQWGQFWYPLRWRLRGFDFRSVEIEDLDLDPDRCNAHGNSGGPDLARVLRVLAVPPGSRILDFGSGKGGAVLTMCEFPFSEIVGLELSPGLIRIAEANCRRAGASRVRFVESDAAWFLDLDRFTHVYMYHPFPCSIVEAVCANLRASLARRERRITLIYKNPVCDAAVLKEGTFRVEREMQFGQSAPDCERFRVYVHEESGRSDP